VVEARPHISAWNYEGVDFHPQINQSGNGKYWQFKEIVLVGFPSILRGIGLASAQVPIVVWCRSPIEHNQMVVEQIVQTFLSMTGYKFGLGQMRTTEIL